MRLQFQLELILILIFNFHGISSLDKIGWWWHALSEGSAWCATQQTVGNIVGWGLAQGRLAQILEEGAFVNDLGA